MGQSFRTRATVDDINPASPIIRNILKAHGQDWAREQASPSWEICRDEASDESFWHRAPGVAEHPPRAEMD